MWSLRIYMRCRKHSRSCGRCRFPVLYKVFQYKSVTGAARMVQSEDVTASPGAGKSFSVQVAPEGALLEVAPFDPAAGVAVPQAIPAVPAAVDGWY